jgi:hypothetical protein
MGLKMNYVLPIVGVLLIIYGMQIDHNATQLEEQVLSALEVGFGLLAIGLGALIGVAKKGFARLEKRLSTAPERERAPPMAETATSLIHRAPPPEKRSWSDKLDDWFAGEKTDPVRPDQDLARMTPTEIREAQRLAGDWKP